MVGSVVSDEYPFTALGSDVALWVVVGTFDGMLVQNVLAKSDQLLPEGPPTNPFPGSQPINAPDEGIQEERSMFHHPRGHGVIHWDLLIDPLLKT